MSNNQEDQMTDENVQSKPNAGEHPTSKENEPPTSSEAKTDPSPLPSTYTLSEEERALLREHRARRIAKSTPRLTLVQRDQKTRLSNDHPVPRFGAMHLERAIGTADSDFFEGLIGRLATSCSAGPPDEDTLNFAFSVIKGIAPRDSTEATLGSQMAAIQAAFMMAAYRYQNATTPAAQEAAERSLNRLARTFAGQMETLKRYRSGGSQTVTVQNVSVSDGGQAIVGNVTQSTRPDVPENPSATPPSVATTTEASAPVCDDHKEIAPTPGKQESSE